MCSCDFDEPSFYVETTPRARKARVCMECRVTIAPGDRYVRVVGKWDDIETTWMCVPCREIAQAISDAGCCWGMRAVQECARETLQEYMGDGHRVLTTVQVAGLGRLAGLLMRQRLEQSSGAASTGEGSG